MLDHPNIEVRTATTFDRRTDEDGHDHVIYTGPIDAYFDYVKGRLPYRSLQFVHQHFADTNQYQTVGTVNFPTSEEFTRITEFKHLSGQQCAGTSVAIEYPTPDGDGYYPIPRPENEKLYKEYESLADAIADRVTFIGRLAQYRYYNMDQVVAAAMVKARQLITRLSA
jgi:UDP-galactopyranose mutase